MTVTAVSARPLPTDAAVHFRPHNQTGAPLGIRCASRAGFTACARPRVSRSRHFPPGFDFVIPHQKIKGSASKKAGNPSPVRILDCFDFRPGNQRNQTLSRQAAPSPKDARELKRPIERSSGSRSGMDANGPNATRGPRQGLQTTTHRDRIVHARPALKAQGERERVALAGPLTRTSAKFPPRSFAPFREAHVMRWPSL
jgi:hypothetical protein